MANTPKRTTGVQSPAPSASKAVPIKTPDNILPSPVEPLVSKAGTMGETNTVAAVAEELVTPTKPATTTPVRGMNTMIKNTEELVALGHENMEALVKSGQIWTTGIEALMKQFAETAKASFDESMATFKAITSAKSITEVMELQNKFATSTAKRALAESNKLVDASVKLTDKMLAPIAARATSVAEAFVKAA